MKKLLSLVFLAMVCLGNMAQAEGIELGVYVSDSDPVTNVRNKPGGSIAMTLPDTCSYMITVTEPTNGWWRVKWITVAETSGYIALTGSSTGWFWIHNSVIGLGTLNYANERWCLRSQPNENGKPVYWFNTEIVVHPLTVKGDWVKVTYNGHTGWIESEKLCDNPLTNCC